MTIYVTLLLLCIAVLIMVSVLLWLVYRVHQRQQKLVKDQDVFHQPKSTNRPAFLENEARITPNRYAHSNLKEADKEQYLHQIIDYLEQTKVYRQPDLTIKKLAKQVAISSQHVSQVINEKLNSSFLDLINRYRVADAKQYLQQPELADTALIEIGRKVGFKAKSTFYAVFKKYTNRSPGDYRKAHLSKTNKLVE